MKPTVCNRWRAMLFALTGQPAPPPPLLPGRRHAAADYEPDSAALLEIGDVGELADRLGIASTRAAARWRIAAARRLADVGDGEGDTPD